MVSRYQQQTQPGPAAVAEPVRSPFAALAGAASDVVAAVHGRLDERQRGLEFAALSTARRQLEEQGTALELELQKTAGAAGAGHVPAVQGKRREMVDRIWAAVPDSVRKSERAQLAWQQIRDQDDSAATQRATVWQRQQETKFATDAIDQDLRAVTAAIEADPDSAESRLAQWRAGLSAYTGLIGAEAVGQVDEASARDIMLASVRGLGKAGRFEEAEALVDRIAASLGVEERSAAAAGIRQERALQQGTAAERYQLGIQRGEYTLADIDAASDIDDGQKATLRAQLQGRTADQVAKDIAAGKAGRGRIDALEQSGEVSTGLANALRAQHLAMVEKARRDLEIERARQAQATIDRHTGNAEALEFQILRGEAGEGEAYLALQNGDIGLPQYNALYRLAQQGEAGRANAAAVLAKVQAGAPLDPYDADTRKGMDAIWEANGGVMLFQKQVVTATDAQGQPMVTANAGTQAVLNAARTAGVIPPGAASALQGMASNGDDQQRQVALDTAAQLFDLYPAAASAAFPDGQDRILKDAISWKLKVAAGVDPVAALRAVERENVAPADPVLRQRATDGQKAAKELGAGNVRAALKEGGIPFLGDAAPMSPEVEAGAVAMLREAFETEYLRTGDAAVALETAGAALKRVMGPTTVGGERRTMAFPPERYYAPGLEQLQPDWMAKQLTADVQDLVSAGALPGIDPGYVVTPGEVRLIPDHVTASDVRGGQPPSYGVSFQGAPLPGRYQFDPAAAMGAAEAGLKDRVRIAERKRAMVESGIFKPEEAQDLAGRSFADRSAFDALTVGRTGPAREVIGLKRPERNADALWRKLQGIDARYAGEGG